MTNACTTPAPDLGYIGSISRFIDCRAETFDIGAFTALAAPGSTLSLMLTGLLTILIALIGYDLLIGRGFDLRAGTLVMVKIGAVLSLVTSWPAYQVLVYDIVTEAPSQIASEIARPAALPGGDGTLVHRLDAADGALQQLAVLGLGDIPQAQAATLPPPPMAGFDAFALGGSRMLFLISALVGLVSVRLVAAMMLALGPYFIAFLLFENTRSLFEGWARIVGGAAIAAIGVSLVLAFELAFLEPWLLDVLTRRAAGEPLPTVPTELFVTMTLFAIALSAALSASFRLASAFRLARWNCRGQSSFSGGVPSSSALIATTGKGNERSTPPSRAARTANAVVSLQRRQDEGNARGSGARITSISQARETEGAAQSAGPNLPTGRSFPRRVTQRSSASAGRRDKTA